MPLTKKQISEIREHLESAQNPFFLFDNDQDGLCSFLLLQKFLRRGKGFPVKNARYPLKGVRQAHRTPHDHFRRLRLEESKSALHRERRRAQRLYGNPHLH